VESRKDGNEGIPGTQFDGRRILEGYDNIGVVELDPAQVGPCNVPLAQFMEPDGRSFQVFVRCRHSPYFVCIHFHTTVFFATSPIMESAFGYIFFDLSLSHSSP
jgi:hypothetical protein